MTIHTTLWSQVKDWLKSEVGESSYASWLAPLEVDVEHKKLKKENDEEELSIANRIYLKIENISFVTRPNANNHPGPSGLKHVILK